MEYRSKFASLLSSHQLLKALGRSSALAGLIALGATLGCSGADVSGEESAATHTDRLVTTIGGWEFKPFALMSFPSNSVGDPAFCTPHGSHSNIMFTRDTSNYIQGNATLPVGGGSAFAKYGSTVNARQLGGRPACAFLSESSSPYPFILLAKGAVAPDGKTADKRLFWSKGQWTTTLGTAPTAVTAFAALDNTQYSVNGNPAVATHNGQLVVVYLNDSGQLLANYWTGSTFSGTLTHPTALPSGWTAVGTPTIAFAENWAQKYVIFVRATNRFSQPKFFATFFENDHFAASYGGTNATFHAVDLPSGAPAISSDPAYEYDNDGEFINTGTLYYRSGSKMYQVSAGNAVDQFDTSTLKAMDVSSTSPNLTGNPVANGGTQFEAGRHWVLVRGSNGVYMGESLQNSGLSAN